MSGVELSVAVIAGIMGYVMISALWPNKKPTQSPDGSSSKSSADSSQQFPPVEPWHVTLGVSPNASADEIKAAYRQLIAQYHPDKVAQLGPELQDLATQMSAHINAAYQEARRERVD
jgi:DnaJ-domain-containing protein 1